MVKIAFDEDSHTYNVNGEIWPSVTRIISPLYDFSRIPVSTLETARKRGTEVHRACEIYDIRGDDFREEYVDPEIIGYVMAWKQFSQECDFEASHIEARVHHAKYRYCGTLDRLGTMDGKMALVDIKTTSALSPAIGVQLAAYEMAARSCGLLSPKARIRRYAVQLDKRGTYKLKRYVDESDERIFLSCLQLFKWRGKHGT